MKMGGIKWGDLFVVVAKIMAIFSPLWKIICIENL